VMDIASPVDGKPARRAVTVSVSEGVLEGRRFGIRAGGLDEE